MYCSLYCLFCMLLISFNKALFSCCIKRNCAVVLDMFVITVALAHQVLSSLFSVPLVAAGITFLNFQKSMTNNPVRTKIVSFSGESLYHFLYVFLFGKMFLMRSATFFGLFLIHFRFFLTSLPFTF